MNQTSQPLPPKYKRLVADLARDAFALFAATSTAQAHERDPADELFQLFVKEGTNPGFESATEIAHFVQDQRTRDLSACATVEEFSEALWPVMASPCSEQRFTVEFTEPGPEFDRLRVGWEIGGPNSVVVEPDSDRPGITVLSGIVRAATLETAVSSSARTIDQVVGAYRALGLSQPVDPGFPRVVIDTAPPTVAFGTIRLEGPHADATREQFVLPPSYALRLRSERFTAPHDLDDFERRALSAGDFDRAFGKSARRLRTLFRNAEGRALEIRNACRLAVLADDADDFGVFTSLAFACIEGLLLDKDSDTNVLARLAEAVAYSVATTHNERTSLRKRVKELYAARSKFVHTGKAIGNDRDWQEVRSVMYRTLRREVELLATE